MSVFPTKKVSFFSKPSVQKCEGVKYAGGSYKPFKKPQPGAKCDVISWLGSFCTYKDDFYTD